MRIKKTKSAKSAAKSGVAKSAKRKSAKPAAKPSGVAAFYAKIAETFVTLGVCGTALFRGRQVKVDGKASVIPTEDTEGNPLRDCQTAFPIGEAIRPRWAGKSESAVPGCSIRAWLGSKRTIPEVKVFRLDVALKSGVVQSVESDKGTLYLPKSWKPSHKLPLIVAAKARGGRFERYTAKDGRNAAFVGFPKVAAS